MMVVFISRLNSVRNLFLQQGLESNTFKHAGNLQVNSRAVQVLAGLGQNVCWSSSLLECVLGLGV